MRRNPKTTVVNGTQIVVFIWVTSIKTTDSGVCYLNRFMDELCKLFGSIMHIFYLLFRASLCSYLTLTTRLQEERGIWGTADKITSCPMSFGSLFLGRVGVGEIKETQRLNNKKRRVFRNSYVTPRMADNIVFLYTFPFSKQRLK